MRRSSFAGAMKRGVSGVRARQRDRHGRRDAAGLRVEHHDAVGLKHASRGLPAPSISDMTAVVIWKPSCARFN
jgi:hypothetical protein